jgi:hypothetical protein
MKWIKEEPKEEGSYLCFMEDGYIKMCYYCEVGGWLDMWKTTLEGDVKYWQPLPEPPTE